MKKIIVLPFISTLDNNLAKNSQFIQVILGPRQVGKTTSVLNYFETNSLYSFHYTSADNSISVGYNWVIEQWQKARESKSVLIIDEIQKIENWAEIIKKLWDEEKRRTVPISCVLLGSSSLDIQRGLTESLAGRFQLIRAFHWNYLESQMGYKVSFDEYLHFGGYPAAYNLIKDVTSWRDYLTSSIVSTVIEKDILSNHTVKSPSLFRQAFEILCSYPAQEISYTKLLGQLQDKGNTDLIRHYIALYEGAYLVKALEKYSVKPLKRKSSSPKILPLCPAFYFLNLLSEYDESEKGRVFELIVGTQLLRTGFELYYWREGNKEVDFVLKKGKIIWGIEVKSGRKKYKNSLDFFTERFPKSRVAVITPENYQDFEKDPMSFLEKIS